MVVCEFCGKPFSYAKNLNQHFLRCKQRDIQMFRVQYESQLQSQKEEYEYQLQIQKNRYESRLTQLETCVDIQRSQIQSQKEQIEKLENQIFEIAKQPTTTVMTSNNHRTVNILNQLGSYEFDPETIARTLEEKFTKEVFQGGPDKIAELTAVVLLQDSEQKPKVICTDTSRKTFRFIDPITQKLETDPGFLKTHSLLKRPLFEANLNVFSRDFMRIDDDDDTYRNQWKLNDDFISNPHRFPEKLFPFLSRRI